MNMLRWGWEYVVHTDGKSYDGQLRHWYRELLTNSTEWMRKNPIFSNWPDHKIRQYNRAFDSGRRYPKTWTNMVNKGWVEKSSDLHSDGKPLEVYKITPLGLKTFHDYMNAISK
jgi:hypothetical protein